jgi:hypothetical protein
MLQESPDEDSQRVTYAQANHSRLRTEGLLLFHTVQGILGQEGTEMWTVR